MTGLLVNVTRLGDSMSGDDPGQIQVMPTFIQDEPPEPEFVSADGQHDAEYAVTKNESGITISYDSSVFEAEAKSVGILGEGPYFALPRVGIDLKLVNNTDEAIFVTDAIINVAKSETNIDPVFVLIHSQGDIGKIVWINDGWGEPDRVSIKAKIEGRDTNPVDLPVSRASFDMYGSAPYEFSIWPLISDLAESEAAYLAAIDQEGAFISGGPPPWTDLHVRCMRKFGDMEEIAEIRTEWDGIPTTPDEITDEILGEFPYGCAVMVTGQLTYEWSKNGKMQTRSAEFTVAVTVTPPDGLGAAGFMPTGEYELELQTDGTDYTLTVPVSQPIAPKSFDRFVIWVGAEKSSAHEMNIVLDYNDGQTITSQPITLDYFRPRSTAGVADFGFE